MVQLCCRGQRQRTTLPTLNSTSMLSARTSKHQLNNQRHADTGVNYRLNDKWHFNVSWQYYIGWYGLIIIIPASPSDGNLHFIRFLRIQWRRNASTTGWTCVCRPARAGSLFVHLISDLQPGEPRKYDLVMITSEDDASCRTAMAVTCTCGP